MRIKYSKYKEEINVSDTRYVLLSKKTGDWAAVSRETKDVIDYAISEKIDIGTACSLFEDEEDYTYIMQILDALISKSIIVEEGDVETCPVEDVTIDFTNLCNLKCIHCLVAAQRTVRKMQLDEDSMKIIIDNVVSTKPESISISGGEPLVRDDFCDLIKYLRDRYSGELILMTNATLIDEDMADFLSQTFNHISVSLDGVNEETCSAIRGQGTFSKAINGIKLLQNAGFDNISASMVETAINTSLVPDFYELCDQLRVRPTIQVFSPIGRGKDNQEILSINHVEIQSENADATSNESEKRYESAGVCTALINSYFVDYKGDVYPCTTLAEKEFCYGNIFHIDNFKGFILDEEFKKTDGFKSFERLSPYSTERCRDCIVRFYCWHCASLHRQDRINDDYCRSMCEDYRMIWGL